MGGFGGHTGPPRRRVLSPRQACDYVEARVYGLFRVSFVARFVIVVACFGAII